METLQPRSGFSSQTSLSGHNPPATPPYTPAKHKRRLERSDSPASSIHPTETSSPAKKVQKRNSSDGLVVIELNDGDPGSFVDVDVVSPAELEEVEDSLIASESESDHVDSDPDSDDSDLDSDSGISSRFSKLNCNEQEEDLIMTQNRLQRRLSKRSSLRVFKRPHSQSANGDNGATDTDDEDERSDASPRRQRRRILSPVSGPIDLEDARSSPEPASLDDVLASVKQESRQHRKVQRTYASVLKGDEDDQTLGS